MEFAMCSLNRRPKRRRQRGFTLLEVMVALAIFALSAMAIVRGTGLSAGQTRYLEQKVLALWIAQDALAQYRVAREWPAVGRHMESKESYHQNWRVEAEVFSTSDPWLRRVEVKVSLDEQQDLVRLQGFIGKY